MQLRTVASSVLFYFFAQSSFEVYGIGIVFLKMEKVPVFSAFIHRFQICDPVFTVTKDMNTYAALTLAR